MFIHFVGLCGNGTGAMLACFCTKTRTNCNWVVGCNNFSSLVSDFESKILVSACSIQGGSPFYRYT